MVVAKVLQVEMGRVCGCGQFGLTLLGPRTLGSLQAGCIVIHKINSGLVHFLFFIIAGIVYNVDLGTGSLVARG